MKRYCLAGFALISTIFLFESCGGKTDNNQAKTMSYTFPDSVTIVQATGRIEPEDGIVDVSSEVSGIIEEVNVQSGDSVKANQSLVTIVSSEARINLLMAKKKLAVEQSNLALQDVAIRKSQLAVKDARNNLEVANRLLEKGADTRQNMLDQKTTLDQNELDLKENEEKKAQIRQNIAQLTENIKLQEDNLAKYDIKARQDGIVLDVSAIKGNSIQPFGKLLTLAPLGPIVVVAEVDELFANYIHMGNRVKIHSVGYSNVIGAGKVIQMSNYLTKKMLFSGLSDEQQDRQVRKIKILLDDQKNYPLIGSKVTCDISISPQ